jgi:predicted RNase H-like nuclease
MSRAGEGAHRSGSASRTARGRRGVDVVGVDGSRAGWYFIRINDTGVRHGVCRTAASLHEQNRSAELILIDVPIGLLDKGPGGRVCDSEARRLLGPPRSSSVFSPPVRAVLQEGDYRAASALNRELTGKGISQQTWGIVPRILDVDRLLRVPGPARRKFREVHPEVLFWGLSGGRPMEHNKKTSDGAEERLDVLLGVFPEASRVITALAGNRPTGVTRDDFLDALCSAVVGRVGGGRLRTLPPDPPRDSRGLPMQIAYLDPRDL